MKKKPGKKSGRMLLIAAILFACWLQFPVGAHVKETLEGTPATCVEDGVTEGKKCKICKKLIKAQQIIPATGLHIYDNDFDKSCKNCTYERELNSKFEFVNHRVVLQDENKSHKNWRVIVYKLGAQTVEDPADEDALLLIDAEAQTHWGITEINRITLTDAGNYVVMLKYNVGVNAAIKVPMPLTITDDPKLFVDSDNRITVVDKNEANQNHVLTLCYMGDMEVADPSNDTIVKNTAIKTETYTGIQQINEITITQGGKYVFYLQYDAADGTKRTVILTETVDSRPALYVDENNRLVTSCDDENIINFRAYVYYLGDQTTSDIYDEKELKNLSSNPVAYWGIKAINNAVLKKPGTYVIHLQYNVGVGPKETVARKVTIN